jgi:hypothetical protein
MDRLFKLIALKTPRFHFGSHGCLKLLIGTLYIRGNVSHVA